MLIGHKKQWEFLKDNFESDRLSHAYLFAGAKEIGKRTFAVEFIKLINCLSEKKPCQKCVNCKMIEKNAFPDLMVVKSADSKSSIENEKDMQEIDVFQIRSAQKSLDLKSYYGSFKSIIVDDAERMNMQAQNCFLKTLEEPKGKTMIILVTSKPDMLLPTIFSRCQTVKFSRPKDLPANPDKLKKQQEILKDLMLVVNSDIADKFKYVKSIDFEEQDVIEIVEVLQKYARHLMLVKTGLGNLKDQGMVFDEKQKTKEYPIPKLKDIINLSEDINNKLLFTNASPRLALEILLMEF